MRWESSACIMKLTVCPSSCVLRSWGSISGVVEASKSAQAAVFPLQRAAFRAWPNSYALVGWRVTEMSSPLQLLSEAGAADLSSSSSTWGRKIRSQKWTFPHADTPSKITQARFKKSQAPCHVDIHDISHLQEDGLGFFLTWTLKHCPSNLHYRLYTSSPN